MGYGSANIPFAPFRDPQIPPSAGPTDGDLFYIAVTGEWMSLIAGCLYALCADSTWDTGDFDTLQQVRAWAFSIIRQCDQRIPVMNLVYRKKPGQVQDWQYSVDGGTTWLEGPDCAIEFTPVFTVNGAAPGGYDLTVNGDLSDVSVPLLTATDPNAVVTDPVSDLVNTIAPGVDINALKAAVSGNATPLQLVNAGITLGNLLELIAAL